MSDSEGKSPPTIPFAAASGNQLFERAVAAIRLDDATVRWLAVSTLNTIGVAPGLLTAEELGHLLPEFDRRLRKLVPEEQAAAALRRLSQVLIELGERS